MTKPDPEKTTTDELYEALDRSAVQLLNRAMGVPEGGALEGEGAGVSVAPAQATVNEQVRVFQAISAYAKSRTETGPKPKAGKSAFDQLQSAFHRGSANGGSGAPVRRARRAKAPAPAPESGDGEYDA